MCIIKLQFDHLGFYNFRIESHGKGILKPHQLLAEYEAISKEDKLKLDDGHGAFAEVIKSTQVN